MFVKFTKEYAGGLIAGAGFMLAMIGFNSIDFSPLHGPIGAIGGLLLVSIGASMALSAQRNRKNKP